MMPQASRAGPQPWMLRSASGGAEAGTEGATSREGAGGDKHQEDPCKGLATRQPKGPFAAASWGALAPGSCRAQWEKGRRLKDVSASRELVLLAAVACAAGGAEPRR